MGKEMRNQAKLLERQREIDPTPEEIRERCAEIQAEWSERERRKRIADPNMKKRRLVYREIHLSRDVLQRIDEEMSYGADVGRGNSPSPLVGEIRTHPE